MWLSEFGLTLCNARILMRGLKAEQVEGRGGMWAVSDIEEHESDVLVTAHHKKFL
jgi:hypothetical protein